MQEPFYIYCTNMKCPRERFINRADKNVQKTAHVSEEEEIDLYRNHAASFNQGSRLVTRLLTSGNYNIAL